MTGPLIVVKYPFVELDLLTVLGAAPISAATGMERRSPWNADAAARVPVLTAFDATGGWPLEAVAAERPDLILCQDGEYDAAGDQLPRIAPTIAFDANVAPDWRADVRLVGAALAREGRAEEAVAATDAVIDEAASRTRPLAGRSVHAVSFYGGETYLLGAGTGVGRSLGDLGVPTRDTGAYEPLAAERLGDLDDTDLLLVLSDGAPEVEEAVAGPLFQALPQVRAGRWARLDRATSIAFDASVLSLRYAVPRLADALVGAADGRAPQLAADPV